ncbi:uncharacterized protein BDZ99DRAFT_516970 [Mytilinidion resinicola]|uniref:Uncharacterized protein n=1 Tax=Mytilinidion resinicola TaxID=574789 RepID=A0A6A6YZV7_9PEZI|nr:uncharacterized protein BDZ99DRAFT_516970 [Mytilinidion resinicola]KAF2814371.1 hypothetical protein BDZ99DRAFT_516970 [Mytilinidion resinicola]
MEHDIINSFKQFSATEKLRIQERQRSIARESKAVKLNDLKKFSSDFKLNTAIPGDLVPILAKDEAKQKEIVQKSMKEARSFYDKEENRRSGNGLEIKAAAQSLVIPGVFVDPAVISSRLAPPRSTSKKPPPDGPAVEMRAAPKAAKKKWMPVPYTPSVVFNLDKPLVTVSAAENIDGLLERVHGNLGINSTTATGPTRVSHNSAPRGQEGLAMGGRRPGNITFGSIPASGSPAISDNLHPESQEELAVLNRQKELNYAKARSPFQTVDDVNWEIDRLQKQVDTGRMKIVDEKKALSELSSLYKARKNVAGFVEQQKAIQELEAQLGRLQHDFDLKKESGVFRTEPSDKYSAARRAYPIDRANGAIAMPPRVTSEAIDGIFAESSRGTEFNTPRSSSFRGTESTAPATFSGEPTRTFDKTQIVQHRIIEEEETDRIEESEAPVLDGQSTISADSVIVLTPQQRTDVIKKFSGALIRDLPSKCFTSHGKAFEESTFRRQFTSCIKGYSKQVMEGAARRSHQRQASKAIRILRNDILNKCYEALGGFDRLERSYPSIILQAQEQNLPEKSIAEKVSDWTYEPSQDAIDDSLHRRQYSHYLDPLSEEFSSVSKAYAISNPAPNPPSDVSSSSLTDADSWSQSDSRGQDDSNDINTEDKPVYTYLTEHPAFSELVDELRTIVERQFCDQKELIHHRILLAIRRPGMIHPTPGGLFQAEFFTEWDILSFLDTQYPLRTSHNLRPIIAITGGPTNAQLTTVEEYLRQNWPIHTWELIDALNTAIEKTNSKFPSEQNDTSEWKIHVSLRDMRISVKGSEDFIVAVGQQLAWLGAACRTSIGQLAHSYVTFTELNLTDTGNLPKPTFQIRYEVLHLLPQEPTSCWNDLVGDSVVVASFPIPERHPNAVGLEVSLQIMAALANIPLVTCFRGGYVLKGRSLLFVPVKRENDFVQWHLLNKPGGRISYHEAVHLFPDRLSVEELDEEALITTKCFLGWCSDSLCRLASKDYDYSSVGYTKTSYLSKRVVSLTGASVGFQQFGAGSLQFAISKKDGMHHADRAQFYADLLDDAKQVPVILQDMEDRRAWYTDGETAILHIILHRHVLKPFEVDQMVGIVSADPNDQQSVRQAMLSNADTPMICDRSMKNPGLQSKRFKHLVGELYSMLEGFMAQTIDIAKTGVEMKLNWKKHVQGWEYMDLVNRKLNPRLRETELKSTCGNWPELARDRNAVILFGNRLQNIIDPHPSVRLCKQFKELPKYKDYLAIQSTTLEEMYLESGSAEDREQVTITGLQLHRSQHLFESCPRSTAHTDSCKCDRIQQLVPKGGKRKIKPVPKSSGSGAVIIGQGSASWINDLGWRPFRNAIQPRASHTQSQPTQLSPQAKSPRQPHFISRILGPQVATYSRDTLQILSRYQPSPTQPRLCLIQDLRGLKSKVPAHQTQRFSSETHGSSAQPDQTGQHERDQRRPPSMQNGPGLLPAKQYYNPSFAMKKPARPTFVDNTQYPRKPTLKDAPRLSSLPLKPNDSSWMYANPEPRLLPGKCEPNYRRGDFLAPILKARQQQAMPTSTPVPRLRLRRRPRFDEVEVPQDSASVSRGGSVIENG